MCSARLLVEGDWITLGLVLEVWNLTSLDSHPTQPRKHAMAAMRVLHTFTMHPATFRTPAAKPLRATSNWRCPPATSQDKGTLPIESATPSHHTATTGGGPLSGGLEKCSSTMAASEVLANLNATASKTT